jgi:hypothetical protein
VLIEGIQQVAIKRDESVSPSLFTSGSHLAAFSIISITHYDGAPAGARALQARATTPNSLLSIFVYLQRFGASALDRVLGELSSENCFPRYLCRA